MNRPRPCLSLVLFAALVPGPLAAVEPPSLTLSADEQAILDLTNKAREKEKLPPVKPNPTLVKVARAHSANMAKQGKMAHVLDGKNPAQRVEAAGYDYSWVGENVAMSNEGAPVEDVFEGWMKSPHHRENILKKEYREIGIGIGRNAQGEVYFTQVFGTRRGGR